MLLHVPSFLHLYDNGELPSELAESLGLGEILLEIRFFSIYFEAWVLFWWVFAQDAFLKSFLFRMLYIYPAKV